MEGNTIVVKAKWKEDMRRFAFVKDTKFNDFRTILCNLFQVNIYSIKYLDDEEDEITITCDDELKEAIRISEKEQKSVLRVSIIGSLQKTNTLLNNKKILSVSNSSGVPEVIIHADDKGNTRLELIKEQMSVSIPQNDSKPTVELRDSGSLISFDISSDELNLSQLAERTVGDVLEMSRSTLQKTMSLAEEATNFGNQERENIRASTAILSKASAEKVIELSRSIAESTEKASLSASLLGEELRKSTLATVAQLSEQTKNRTDELSRQTAQRLDEVLKALKLTSN